MQVFLTPRCETQAGFLETMQTDCGVGNNNNNNSSNSNNHRHNNAKVVLQ